MDKVIDADQYPVRDSEIQTEFDRSLEDMLVGESIKLTGFRGIINLRGFLKHAIPNFSGPEKYHYHLFREYEHVINENSLTYTVRRLK